MASHSDHSMLDLRGQVALVTGGNGGIGLGMARGLAGAGADVVVWGTDERKNREARAELERLGVRSLAVRCDVGDEASVEQAFAETLDAFGKVTACFANAGIAPRRAPFVEQTLDDWRRVMRVNLEGTFLTLRAAARHMVQRGEGGSLVAVSSLGELQGMPQAQSYAASKGAVSALTNGLAVELARHGIRANTILPGWIRTAMTPHLDTEPLRENVLRRVPTRRWGTPDDFAGIAVYLASPASAYHTGQSFVVDGGYLRF
jgi:NAD(P)-dependent dehydrogenase (short-subunit alcohol dehydrogenase family)